MSAKSVNSFRRGSELAFQKDVRKNSLNGLLFNPPVVLVLVVSHPLFVPIMILFTSPSSFSFSRFSPGEDSGHSQSSLTTHSMALFPHSHTDWTASREQRTNASFIIMMLNQVLEQLLQ